MEWISVKDRLPTLRDGIGGILVFRFGDWQTAAFNASDMIINCVISPNSFYDHAEDGWYELDGVTHFMPIEPPLDGEVGK